MFPLVIRLLTVGGEPTDLGLVGPVPPASCWLEGCDTTLRCGRSGLKLAPLCLVWGPSCRLRPMDAWQSVFEHIRAKDRPNTTHVQHQWTGTQQAHLGRVVSCSHGCWLRPPPQTKCLSWLAAEEAAGKTLCRPPPAPHPRGLRPHRYRNVQVPGNEGAAATVVAAAASHSAEHQHLRGYWWGYPRGF